MSNLSQDSVALLSWSGEPDRIIQDVQWVLEDREDSTNQLRATTTLAEADGVEDEQELIFQQRRFIVSGVERDRDADRATIVADEAQVELAGPILTDFEFNSWTAFQALEHALKDTRWTPGEVVNVRFGRAQFEDLTVLEACHFLANHQDAFVTFDSLRRRVNLTTSRGRTLERVFTYGRELTNIEKESRQPVTTVIYPTGADDMTIASVNGGREYVEDYGYYTSRGISLSNARLWYRKEDYWDDNRYEVPSNLLRDAQKRLAEEAYPAITYTLTAQVTTATDGTDDDLDLTGIGLGDRVYVWDDEIDTRLVAEVAAVTTSSDQSRNELVLSTLPESFGGTGARGSGRYFGDSGSTAGNPLFPRSGFQPRPSMPILENVTDVGVGTVRWNGQDHDGNYTTIPVRFGSVIPVVAKLAEDGSIPSPDSDDAYEGTRINSRGGGLATVAFGSPGEFAVWFYMLGNDQHTRSEYSEPLVVDVPALVDVEQIDAVLDAANDRIDQAREDADQKFRDYDQRQDQFESSISDARDRLTAAEQTLSPLPGRIGEAETRVESAVAAAESAEARAVEASNNAGNRLQNGGFELGLDHWTVTNVSLSDDAHTGNQAALIGSGGSLSPDASIPVSEGDVWNVSAYAKDGDALVIDVLDATTGTVLESFTTPTNGVWSETGQLRTEIPAGVSYLNLRITGDDVLVDDIVLRDVTDVVRLERAATQARQTAEQAIADLEVLQLAVDGEGGLRDRLDTAETVLEDKADTSELNQLDEKLASNLAAIESHYTRVWRQPTPPPPGTHYAWLGERHASESVMLDTDGNEIARNIIANPSFETDLIGWGNYQGAAFNRTSAYRGTMWDGIGGEYRLAVEVGDWAQNRVQTVLDLDQVAGKWVAVRALVATGATGEEVFLEIENQGASVDREILEITDDASFYDGALLSGATLIPENVTLSRIFIRFYGGDDGRGWLDEVHASVADTEAEALAQVSRYFDGDSLSDRANDLWRDADGVPHEWVNGQGWVELSDARIEQLAGQIATLDERLGTAEITLQEKADTSDLNQLDQKLDTNVNTLSNRIGTAETTLGRKADTSALNDLSGTVSSNQSAISSTQQELNEAKTELNTALTGPVDHERLRVGSGAFNEAFIARLVAESVQAMSAEFENLTVTELANFARIIGDEIWAELAVFERLDAREAYVGGTHLADGAVTADKMTITGDLAAAIINADQARVAELISDHVWAELGVFARLDAREAYVGGVHLKDGAVTAEKMTITGDLAAAIIEADKARIAELIADEMWAELGVFDRLDAREAYVGETHLKNGVVTAEKLHATREMITKILGTEWAYVAERLVVDGEIITNHITAINAAMQQLSVTERADFVDAFADELYADQFTARVATLSRAIVAAPNLIPNGSGWGEDKPEGFSEFGYRGDLSNKALLLDGTSSRFTDIPFELQAGEKYQASVSVRADVPNTRFYMYLIGQTTGASVTLFNGVQQTEGLTYQNFTNDFEIPVTDEYLIQVFPNHPNGADNADGYQWYTDLRIESMLDGRLTVPGTIDVGHLNVTEAMTAALLRAKKVEADDLDANAINGMTIEGGVVKGGRVEGAQFEGGELRTGARFRGTGNAGLEVDIYGVFRRWNTAGDLDTVIDGNNNRFTGRVSTARPGSPGLIIEPASSNANRPGIYMSPDGSASGDHGGIYTDNLWRLVLRGRRTSSGATRNRIVVEGGFYITEGQLTSDVLTTLTAALNVSSSTGRTNNFYNRSAFHDRIYYPGASNTTVDPNIVLRSSSSSPYQYLWRTSSVRSEKLNIETVPDDIAERVLDLDPQDWLDRGAIETGLEDTSLIHDHDEPGVGPTVNEDELADKLGAIPRRVPGLVAEDVRDAGLDDYVTYDIDEETGEEKLTGVSYSRLWTLLIPLVRKQRDQLKEQQSRIDDLEARLARLEAKL